MKATYLLSAESKPALFAALSTLEIPNPDGDPVRLIDNMDGEPDGVLMTESNQHWAMFAMAPTGAALQHRGNVVVTPSVPVVRLVTVEPLSREALLAVIEAGATLVADRDGWPRFQGEGEVIAEVPPEPEADLPIIANEDGLGEPLATFEPTPISDLEPLASGVPTDDAPPLADAGPVTSDGEVE